MDEKDTGAVEPEVTDSDLRKSTEELSALLKALEQGTNGGLAEAAGGETLDPDLESETAATDGDGGAMTFAETFHMDDDEDDMNEKVEKSLAQAFADQEGIAEAAQTSEFARDLALAMIEGLAITSEAMTKSLADVDSSLTVKLAETEARSNEKFSTIAKSLVAMASAVEQIAAQITAVSNAPSSGRKAVVAGAPMNKAFGTDERQPLVKSIVLAHLEQMAQKGEVSAMDIVRYESAGVIDPVLEARVRSELGQ